MRALRLNDRRLLSIRQRRTLGVSEPRFGGCCATAACRLSAPAAERVPSGRSRRLMSGVNEILRKTAFAVSNAPDAASSTPVMRARTARVHGAAHLPRVRDARRLRRLRRRQLRRLGAWGGHERGRLVPGWAADLASYGSAGEGARAHFPSGWRSFGATATERV